MQREHRRYPELHYQKARYGGTPTSCQMTSPMFLSADAPLVLRRSRVALSECDVRTDFPWPLYGRVDQVFVDDARATAILVDTKSRSRRVTYQSDVIQLSVYRVIIDRQSERYLGGRYRVSSTGYIRIPGRVSREDDYIAVELLPTSEVVALAVRHSALRQDRLAASPLLIERPKFCETCTVRNRCDRVVGRS